MSIFKPQYNLCVIPLKDFENRLKEWFTREKGIDVDFHFTFEYPERGFSKMGDLYFKIKEENMTLIDLEKLRNEYVDYPSEEIVGIYIFPNILKDFFGVDSIHYDFDVNKEELHIRTDI